MPEYERAPVVPDDGRLRDAQRVHEIDDVPGQHGAGDGVGQAGGVNNLTFCQETENIAQGNVQRLAHTVRHVADIHLDRNEIEQAEPLYKQALDLYGDDEGTKPLDYANAMVTPRQPKAADAIENWQEPFAGPMNAKPG